MSDAPRPSRAALAGPTVAYRVERGVSVAASSPPRCQVGGFDGSNSQFHSEIETLLRSRLRLSALILLAPTVFFLVKYLIERDPRSVHDWRSLFVQMAAIIAVAVLGGLVWLRPCLSLSKLRAVELAIFGSMAALFAWLQFDAFHSNKLYDLAAGEHELLILRLVAGTTSLRWFFLIVLYGVFIPNRVRRCGAVVAAMVLTALALTAMGAYHRGHLDGELFSALADMLGLLLTGAAVAVFGSYRLDVLQHQAFTAQQLGQYRLRKKLGAGGMGEVYLAEHLLLRRPCAVKLIRPDHSGDPTHLQRFEREVRAMATLTHWNTVEVFDYGHAEDGTFYYVMEYLPGQNLESLVVRHGPLVPGRVVHFLRQVCGALREAHGIGLLHRDIKPSNIIACQRGGVPDVAKLLDFGLVQETGLRPDADKLTVKGTILGSPPYMSPEQAAGKASLDARSDIYSLGGVAYFLLTGQPPFQKETPLEMLLAHAYEAPPPPRTLRPGTPLDVEAVVLRCLAKSPDDRFADVASLERALGACACAGDWTEDLAVVWWREQAAAVETGTIDGVRTQVSPTV